MKLKYRVRTFVLFLMLFTIFSTYFMPVQTAYGANLPYYDYTKGTNVNYSGKQVIYLYNSRELPLEQPGIIIDGTALADCDGLFVQQLELSVTKENDQLTITDGAKTMIMTIGSKNVIMDGVTQKMNVAPVKLSFSDGKVRIYVPTRIITEYFGFSYVWISSSSTVKITKTLSLHDGNHDFSYNGTFYSILYQGNEIPLGKMPIIYYEGTVLTRADIVFRTAGCFYEEFGNQILVSKGDIVISTTFYDKIAYVNGKKFVMDAAPYRITDKETTETYTYMPLEFMAEVLGFELTYDDKLKQYALAETFCTGISAYNTLLNTSDNDAGLFTDAENVYYHWEGTRQSTGENASLQYLTEVKAYAEENADVVELFGVTSENITAFLDGGLLIVELNNTISCLEDQYYNDYENAHLTYTLLSGLSNQTVLYFMIPPEDTWHIVDREGYVQIYFTAADLTLEDLIPSSVIQTNYPDDLLVIPLPETVSRITDQDNYLDNNFQIRLAGNHVNFYRSNAIYNPYYVIRNYTVNYDEVSDCTILTFRTNSICGYEYSVGPDTLYVRVGRPNEIYSKIVVLDAGHGGIDPGASKSGVNEKDLNFTIMNTYVKNKFKNSDIKIYFTRDTDVLIDLYDRAAFASEIGADLFLSLHMNANNSGSVSGTEIFYSTSNNALTTSGLNSYMLANALAGNISSAMGTKNRGVSSAEFVVVKYNTVPAVLIELGFMTNSGDFAKITNQIYQEKAAEAIFETVVQIFQLFPTGR